MIRVCVCRFDPKHAAVVRGAASVPRGSPDSAPAPTTTSTATTTAATTKLFAPAATTSAAARTHWTDAHGAGHDANDAAGIPAYARAAAPGTTSASLRKPLSRHVAPSRAHDGTDGQRSRTPEPTATAPSTPALSATGRCNAKARAAGPYVRVGYSRRGRVAVPISYHGRPDAGR